MDEDKPKWTFFFDSADVEKKLEMERARNLIRPTLNEAVRLFKEAPEVYVEGTLTMLKFWENQTEAILDRLGFVEKRDTSLLGNIAEITTYQRQDLKDIYDKVEKLAKEVEQLKIKL